MSPNKSPQVLSVRTYFNIFRNPNEAHTGPVTLDEQRKALERFVRWHRRQVEVGEQMLAMLDAAHAPAGAEVSPDSGD